MGSALADLRAAYADREAAAVRWRANGGKVVGYVGPDVPRELVTAAGVLPLRVAVRPGTAGELGDRLLGRGVDERVRLLATQLWSADAGPYDALVLSHEDEPTVRLYTSLRELLRIEPRPFPALLFLDLLHLPGAATEAYDRESLRLLREALGVSSGDERLAAAIAEQNENRRLVARLQELRRGDPPRLAGTDALAAIGAGTAMSTRAHNELLASLLRDADTLAPVRCRSRVYLTGSDHEQPTVYEAVEALGGTVVGEDHDWGERAHDGLVAEDGDPLAALAARYHRGSATARRDATDDRSAYTAREAAAARADVVVAWIREHDDAHAWDVPAQRRLLADAGIPLVVLAHRPFRPRDAALVAAELETALAAGAAT